MLRHCGYAIALGLAAAGLAAAQSASEPATDGTPLQPFTATFYVEWRGMSAGLSTLTLKPLADGEYVYESRNVARGLFRIAIPGTVTQSSRFALINGVVTPSSYRADDGSQDTDRDVTLDFDWTVREARGTAEGKPVKIPLEAGTQDALSVQIALMVELAAGRTPEHFWLLDKDELKEYRYTRDGTGAVDTPLGRIETIIYRSERTGSTRVTRLWLAPGLNFLPVRAEQLRDGKRELSMRLRDLKKE